MTSAPGEDLGTRYRRLAEYLGALPGGIAAHPECRARRGVVEAVLSAVPRFTDPAPALVSDLLTMPRGRWIPEVSFHGAILAMADRAGWSDIQLLAWHRALNRRLFRGPVYRAVMAFFSPRLLLEHGASRWNSFHAGTSLEVTAQGERGGTAVLRHPPHLFTPLLLKIYAEAFGAALENARAEGRIVVELAEAGESSARFVARW